MAHLKRIKENVDSPVVSDVVEDQPAVAVQLVESISWRVSQIIKQLFDVFSLLSESYKVDVDVPPAQICLYATRIPESEGQTAE